MLRMTNATKANIIAAINALFGLLTTFDVALTEVQKGAVITFANALLAIFVGTTYKMSRKRISD